MKRVVRPEAAAAPTEEFRDQPPAVLDVTPPRLPSPARPTSQWIIADVPDFSAARGLASTNRQLHRGVAWHLAFSDGQAIDIEGAGLVGRNPNREGDYAHRIRIDDRAKLLSRGQFEFGVTANGILWARDLGSSNGTFLAVEGQPLAPLSAAQRTQLPPGAVLRFGDYSARATRDVP